MKELLAASKAAVSRNRSDTTGVALKTGGREKEVELSMASKATVSGVFWDKALELMVTGKPSVLSGNPSLRGLRQNDSTEYIMRRSN